MSEEFTKQFGIKSGLGPTTIDGDYQWNRCWSGVREAWIPAIKNFIRNIKEKYVLETADMDENDPLIQVVIDQIKEKFGYLVIYCTCRGENRIEIEDNVDDMINKCKQEAMAADPYYGYRGKGHFTE